MHTELGPDWPTLSNEFRILSAYSLLSVNSFVPYQQIAQTNAWLRLDEPPLALLFLSHRWEGVKHPDQSGNQLRAIQGLLKNTCLVMRALFAEREQRLTLVPDLNQESILQASELARRILGYGPFSGGRALSDERRARSYVRAQVKALEPEKFDDWLLEHIGVWVDFCCVPQQPRSRGESEVFDQTLARIDTLLAASTVIALRHAYDDYAERAWCVSEIWLGARRSFQRSLFLDIDRAHKGLAPLLPDKSNAAYHTDGKDKNGDLAAFQSSIGRWQDEAVPLEHTPPDPLVGIPHAARKRINLDNERSQSRPAGG